MKMEKQILQAIQMSRGVMENYQLGEVSTSIIAVGSADKLRKIAASSDVVEALTTTIKEMPYSELAKEKLCEYVRDITTSGYLSNLINLILEYAKLIELYGAFQVSNIIEQFNDYKSVVLSATAEQNTIVSQYFNVGHNETIFSSRIGRGSEVLSLLKEGVSNEIYGQDFSPKDLVIAEVRFYLQGTANVHLKQSNILMEQAFEDMTFDYAYDTPRFGYKPQFEYESMQKDSRFNYFGVPGRMNADLGFVVATIHQLNEKGKGAFYVTTGTLSRSGADAKIRNRFIMSDCIEAAIEFPAGLYAPFAGIGSVLLLVNKAKRAEAKNTVLFINAATLVETERRKAVLTEEGVQLISEILTERKEVEGISKIVRNNDIVDADLVPSRYVFESKMELEEYGKVEVNIQELDKIETIPLKDAVTIFRGYNALPKDEKQDGNVAMLKIADIEDGNINLSNLTRYELGGRVKIDNYRLQRGDIVLSIRGQLKLALFDSEKNDVLLSQNFVGIRCNHQYNPQFVKLYLESPTMQFIMHNQLTGSTVLNLATKDIEELKIPVLAIEEQCKIVQQYNEQQQVLQEELQKIREQIINSKLEAFNMMGIGKTFSLN